MADSNKTSEPERTVLESPGEPSPETPQAGSSDAVANNSVDTDQGDRRPIKSRDSSWAAAVTAWLARRGVTPNQISIAGMMAAIIAGVAIAFGGQESWPERLLLVIAAALMEIRLLGNLFDGMVAVEQGGSTAIGKLYNEIPDRISDGAIFFAAGFCPGATVGLGLGAVCVSIFVAYIRAADRAAGTPADFRGPMAMICPPDMYHPLC